MMRLNMSRAGSALLRALIARAQAPAGTLRLTAYRGTEWRALTMDGERHEYALSFDGPDRAAWADQFLRGLDEHEFELGTTCVADIIGRRVGGSGAASLELVVEALTISA